MDGFENKITQVSYFVHFKPIIVVLPDWKKGAGWMGVENTTEVNDAFDYLLKVSDQLEYTSNQQQKP